MIEDELRAAFARLEESTPPVGPVRAAVDRAVITRRRHRRRVRLAGTALAVAAVALGGFTAMAPRPPAPTAAPLLATPEPAPGGALNVLLLGVDQAAGSRRADSILLVHVPADRSRLFLVSLPRDLLVPMPEQGGLGKLNATFSRAAGSGTDLAAGFRATRQAVARLTGVRVDAGAVLTYPGARELTDAVGGVPVCLPEPVRSVHTGRRFPSGCQRLNGAAAVDLLRQRYGLRDGGLDRDRNAARYAAGLLHQMREQGTATDPAQLGRLLLRVGSAVTVDTGDLSLPALVAASGRAAAAEPVAVAFPVLAEWNGRGYEPDRELTPGLLDALRADRLGEWAAAHPAWVTSLR
ncbi:LytR family transcriptional regulator [Micromonospora sp. TSRI0369]|uniref:LCP family protein n=1 Tax=Micromonospora sp. TSRI0369 TaxID=1703936 RepID=UPI00093C8A88|nr:LCP family protein [Micromonospora sp. TSRI0369]OKJ47831.1 LytR family transcriptional regulator [Micromonospora sp. TSRI0369]